MLQGKPSVIGMLLCFLAGGLAVGVLDRVWNPAPIIARANADQNQATPQPGTPPTPWLKGTTDEKFAQIERHLRGLDSTMAEIGYRYGELLVAGTTRNWEYAQYQTEKIDLSLRLAIERRPKRAKSSEPFLNDNLPAVVHAIKAKSGEKLDVALEKLHAGCVQCHQAEEVLYFKESVDRIKEGARVNVKLFGTPKAPEPEAMLIEPAGLKQKLRQPGLRILDARPRSEYDKGRIPGAAWVDVKRWQEQGRKEGGLHDAKAWGEMVGSLGIDHDFHVVVYGGNITDTARIWWSLKYLGLQKVTLLNGGWQLWVKANHPTEIVRSDVATVKFEPKFQTDRLEEIDSLKKAIKAGEVTVVDARSADEFTGKDIRGRRGGHIPGAKHLEWKELLKEDGRFKSPQQLRALFRERGIHPEQTAVTC
jgi:thiosulfate/3-mercaptopyruvate sulfurtransferase